MSGIEDYPDFKRYVWDDPSLCNNCYRQVKQVVPVWKEGYRNSLQSVLSDTMQFRTESGTVGYRKVTDREGRPINVYRQTTVCDGCGSVGCVSIPDTVSKRELLTRLDRILVWFNKQSVEVDEKTMRRIVHERKGDPDHQGKDPEILAEAVEGGL